jgi:putative phosphoesterase
MSKEPLMKILVLSDSHGKVQQMAAIAELERPDLIMHLGDHASDLERFAELLKLRLPTTICTGVTGNDFRDISAQPERQLLNLYGHKFFLIHGHQYGVKRSLDSIIYAAQEYEADVLLFGHTHIPHLSKIGELTILNPGAANLGYYALIEIDDNYKLTAKLH